MTGTCLFCQTEFRKRERKYKFCSLTCSNRFNRNGLKQLTLPLYSEMLAEFVGICLGDGNTYTYQTGVTLNSIADKEYIPYVQNIMEKLFPGVTISSVNKFHENAVELKINSTLVSQYMCVNGIISRHKFIPEWIDRNSIYKKACVRGLIDTEGSISFKKYVSKRGVSLFKQLNFRNIDKKLMAFVRDTLCGVGLTPTMTLKSSLYISNHKDIARYREVIGFGNPKLLQKSYITNIKMLTQL